MVEETLKWCIETGDVNGFESVISSVSTILKVLIFR